MDSPSSLIKKLDLSPLHMEGGYFKETYRSDEVILQEALPVRYSRPKNFSTAIYYLLTPETFSALHRLPTDEIFHFYLGDSVLMLLLNEDSSSETVVLGHNLADGHQVQVVVPKGTWQGSFLISGGKFALMGATMAPGFDEADYEPGDLSYLLERFSDREDLIRRLI